MIDFLDDQCLHSAKYKCFDKSGLLVMDLQYDVSTSLGFGGTQMITSTGMRSLRLLRLALVLLQRHNMKSFR